MKLLEKRPEDRFTSAAEALLALDDPGMITASPSRRPVGCGRGADEAADAVAKVESELEQERWVVALHSCDDAAVGGATAGTIAALRGRALVGVGQVVPALEAFRTALEAADPPTAPEFAAMANATVAVSPELAIAAALRASDAATAASERSQDPLAYVTGQLVVLLSEAPGDEEILLAVLIGCTQLALAKTIDGRVKQARAFFRQGREAGRVLLTHAWRENRPLCREAAIHVALCEWVCGDDEGIAEALQVTGRDPDDLLGDDCRDAAVRIYALAALELGGQTARVSRLVTEWTRVAFVLGVLGD